MKSIKEYVPQALEGVENLIVAGTEKPIGFMGTQNGRLEMLFIEPKERGKGIGKQLLQYGFQNYGIHEVMVNEQNPQAVGFCTGSGIEINDDKLCMIDLFWRMEVDNLKWM